jgi:hypothetical protein
MIDGKPASGIHVSFQPIGSGSNKTPGGGSVGITDAEGRYTLKMVENESNGAVVGEHRVEISVRITDESATDSRPRGPRPVIPAKYNKDSKLTFTVPAGGTSEANFEITSK